MRNDFLRKFPKKEDTRPKKKGYHYIKIKIFINNKTLLMAQGTIFNILQYTKMEKNTKKNIYIYIF